ncbi:MAG: DUF3488 domain-containing transglutaminase family protein [Hahellaceae bacterium]|nr:DUF3488 domain-containing transglutaminase family protein [Hahellaceae bacterium]
MKSGVLLKGGKLFWLLLAFIVSFLPVLISLPGNLVGLITGLFAFRILIQLGKFHFPGRWMKTLLVAIAGLLYFFEYRYQYTVETAVNFFVMFSALKLLEIRFERDCHLLIYLLLYLNSTRFLFEQGILWTIYVWSAMLLCLFALVKLHSSPAGKSLVSGLGRFFGLISFTIPLVIILFIFFPRFGPLWQFHLDTGKGKTGISDQFSPGDIASLSQSGERAFRVTFSGEAPAKSEWYWRGLIFDEFDGRTWRQSELLGVLAAKVSQPGLTAAQLKSWPSYEVLLDPTQQRWGFGLSNSMVAGNDPVRTGEGLFRFAQNVEQPKQYQLYWRENDEISSVAPATRDLRLPANIGTRARNWIDERQRKGLTGSALIAEILAFYRNEPFFYTLRPPQIEKDLVDEFLFDSRQGFCSHYAGSMVFLLRAAGIPARLVGGYQGGELGEDGRYIIVHQYDAHAWVEAWLPETGWRRYDPTAQVAPERILNGLEMAVAEEGSFLEGVIFSARKFDNVSVVRWLRLKMDSLNYSWQRWVVGYNGETQENFLKDMLGTVSATSLAVALALVGGGVLTLMSIVVVWSGRRSVLPPSLVLFKKLEKRLSKAGIKRETGETLRAYLVRASEIVPDAKPELMAFLQRLEFIHYASSLPADVREKKVLAPMRRLLQDIVRILKSVQIK